MAPRKKTPASNTKDKGVLQPSKAGVKKATKEKVARNKAVKETAVPNTQAPVKPFKNGLVNLTKMPDHLLMKAQRNATESPLLRLPPEIRIKIWTFAVKVDLVLVPTEYCWKSGRHRFTKGGAVAVKDDGAIASRHRRTAERCCPFRRLGAFHLPEVCRQIYIDTSTLAYSSNIFLVGRESLVHNNWAKKMIMMAQRDAIARVELGEDILDEQLFYGHQLRISLKERGFRNLTHVHVSFHTQNLLVKDRRGHGYMRKYRLQGTEELLAWCEARLKEIEGSDLVVVFEEDNTPKADVHTTSAGD